MNRVGLAAIIEEVEKSGLVNLSEILQNITKYVVLRKNIDRLLMQMVPFKKYKKMSPHKK